eukprot:scaffold8631_cov108-Isochrysis_galbana.AAC.7
MGSAKMMGSRVSERTSSRTSDLAMTRPTESHVAHQRAVVPVTLVRDDSEAGARILTHHEERLALGRALAVGRVPPLEHLGREVRHLLHARGRISPDLVECLIAQLEDGPQPARDERAQTIIPSIIFVVPEEQLRVAPLKQGVEHLLAPVGYGVAIQLKERPKCVELDALELA